MKKIKLADVLWDAANRELWAGRGDNRLRTIFHSCNAYTWAARRHLGDGAYPPNFLRTLGAPREPGVFPRGVDEQDCRYMFLLLAMHVAEDEGIEIEASA